MTTAQAIILSVYLVGYLISFGIMLGKADDLKISDFIPLLIVSLISWIGIGLYLSGYSPGKKSTRL